ncbi:MAG: transglutaminase domain-containing protein [Candidatus Latescibacteria bacterium]|nr:transglutaminase domain-containing protein [Candidatus Latescibacterota bacterium]
MHRNVIFCLITLVIFIGAVGSAESETVITQWGGDAEIVYDTGFMERLMKHPGGGISLFNMELIENDSPGSGHSEKGVYTDTIWGENRARKILYLDDPRAESAWLIIFPHYRSGKYPLKFKVNGKESALPDWDTEKNIEWYRWSKFPAAWLKRGKNVIELYCPEAQTEEEGWKIFISRADEFVNGGGNPENVGKTSFKSTNGGESWNESPFGPLNKTRAEYSIRISLDRSAESGWLASPVIDLWKGDSEDFIIPLREIRKMRLIIEAEVPEGTKVEYFFRKGTNPQPFSDEWEPYQFVGRGPKLDFETGGADLNRRYVQFRAVLSTEDPLKSPVVRSANVTAELFERVPLHENIRVIDFENPPIKYSSVPWEWEKWDRSEFKELRERENLDEVIAGSRTQFDAQVKLLDYVTKRWRHNSPFPEFPAWDALSILDRIEYAGGGGYCLTFNNVLGGMCMAYGWQARFINVVGHEIIEVWNDEYGKWIFLDADYENNYNYAVETGEPLNLLELHDLYLDYYFPGHTLDWMTDKFEWKKIDEDRPAPVKRGSLTHHKGTRTSGFINAAFMRMVPRNNWYEKPYPRPLTHGSGTNWPWNGYVNWYDERTPPKRNYSWHTDRPRDMWPDLNKVHVDAASGFGNDRLFLRFETYTPNFSHFEVDVDDTGWKKVGERWTWLLQSGRNTFRVRAVNKLGAKGKPSRVILNHADAQLGEYIK